MPMTVTPPGQSPPDRGFPKSTDRVIDVIEIRLDAEGKAYDYLSGGYLKLVKTDDSLCLSVGTDEGQYCTLTDDSKITFW